MNNKVMRDGKRKLCRTCRYRAGNGKRGCDFMYLTGQSRGCDVDECTVYKKGPRMNKANIPAWSGDSCYEY